jgi:hypothetical protein
MFLRSFQKKVLQVRILKMYEKKLLSEHSYKNVPLFTGCVGRILYGSCDSTCIIIER